jgi:hypothetical protein
MRHYCGCWPSDICSDACLARCAGGSGHYQCQRGSTLIAIAKSGTEGGGSASAVSQKAFAWRQAGSSDGTNGPSEPHPRWSLYVAALVANSLCREQEKCMVRESEVQIGNSGSNVLAYGLWFSLRLQSLPTFCWQIPPRPLYHRK